MLQIIRDRAQGIFAYLIVGAIVLSFALWGVNSYFSDTDEGFQAALVNGQKVGVYEYQIAYNNEKNRMQQMFGNNFDPDLFDDQIKKSAMERVISNALMIQQATNNGMYVSDEQLAQRVQAIEDFREEGRFSRTRYEQLISGAGESVAGFENRVRRGLIADQLLNGIVQTGFTTNDELDEMLKLQQQTREVGYVTLPLSKFKNDIKISDEEIQAHYDNNKESYKSQEMVKLDYVELKVEDLMQSVDVDESELQSFYDEQKSRFMTADQRRARHILIEFGDDETKAQEKAQSLYDKVKAGEDFAELAKANSADAGSAEQGGDLGFFSQGIMDKNFEEATWALHPGEISEPVRTEFGFHIIKLEEIKPGEGKTFSEVKDQVSSEVKRKKAEKIYFDKVEQLANLAYETPDTLFPITEELKLKMTTSPFITRNGGAGVFKNRKVADIAFSDEILKENLNSEVIEISPTHSIVVRLKEYKPAEIRPLSEVKSQIENKLKTEKAMEAAKQEAVALEAKIKEGAAPDDVASEKEFKWNEKKWIKRDEAGVPREVVKALFEMPRIEEGKMEAKGIKLNNGDYALILYSGVKEGDLSSVSEEDKKSLRETLVGANGVENFTAFLKSLEKEAEIKRFPANL